MLTEIVLVFPLVSAALVCVEQQTPEVIENDERRRQRRLVVVLLRQTVAVEAPRLDADVLHHLERVAATPSRNKLLQYSQP